MARQTPRPTPTATQTLQPLVRHCLCCGETLWAVAYPWAADKYLRPLASRLRSINQPVMLTRNAFSTPRPTQLACL